MSFNTLIDWNSCSPEQQRTLLFRATAVPVNQGIEAHGLYSNTGFRLIRTTEPKISTHYVGLKSTAPSGV
ncbi:hypothetical protein, partial [Salmonella enterica]|uniref:hypothetical protein n=1 Tax=Salmonella enterica TaxID=28901 RepID=UPI000AD45B0D